MRRALVLATLLSAIAAPRLAHANGGNSHAWISLHAVEHLPDGELKRMLARPELRAMLVNGSIFPDGGYVANDPYGEMAHWEPFLEAYVEYLRLHLEHPYTQGAAAEQVAFLFGVASHGMADQVFDASFMDAARGYDAAGWSDELLTSFDTMTDVMLVDSTGVSFLDLSPWVPAADISTVFHDALGYDVSPDILDSTQELMHRLILNYAVSTAMDAGKVADARARYPWASDHLMDAGVVGSPPCEGEVVAAYWQALWDRLHEVSGAQNVIVATYPRDGSAGHPTDSTTIESQLFVVFGSGVRRADLAGRFTVTDSHGGVHDVAVDTQYGADEANLVRLRPMEDWPADETFTVTLAPGLVLNDGVTVEAPWSFTFSTAAGDAGAPTSDPTPHVGEPDVGEAPEAPAEDGGCAVGGGAGLGVALAALFLRRTRRARS